MSVEQELIYSWWELKPIQSLWKTVLLFITKVKHTIPLRSVHQIDGHAECTKRPGKEWA